MRRGLAQIQGGRQQKRNKQRQRLSVGMEACAKKTGNTEYESGEKIVGQEISPCSEIMICSVGKACNEGLTEEEEVKWQRQLRIKVVKDTTKKIRSKEGWMHATAGGSVNC